LGKKCVCDIEKKGRKYGSKFYFDVMENGWYIFMFLVGVWFYLEYEKRREGCSY
jgi:hypothetical protein